MHESSLQTGPSTVELRVRGTPGGISLKSFLDMMTACLSALRDLDGAISHQAGGTLEWYVKGLHSSDLTATIDPHPKKGLAGDYGPAIVRSFVGGLGQIQREAVIPPYFSPGTLRSVGRIAKGFGGNGATSFRVTLLGTGSVATIDREARPHIETLLAPRYHALGSVVGRLDMISVHRGNHFNLYGLRTNKGVLCKFDPDHLQAAKDALGSTVVATGRVHRNVNGDAIRLEVDEIRPWPLAGRLPAVDEIYGSDPGFTGDLTTEEFLAEVGR